MRKPVVLMAMATMLIAGYARADWTELEKKVGMAAQLMMDKKYKESRKILEKIPKNADQYSTAQEMLSRISMIHLNYADGFKHIKNCLAAQKFEKMDKARRESLYYQDLVAVGNWYRSKKDHDTAYEAFIMARALNPRGPRAGKMWHTYTNKWLGEKDYDRVIRLNEEALKTLPGHPSLLWPVGLAKRGKGDNEGALAAFMLAAERDGEAFVQAARSYEDLGKKQEAIDLLVRALKAPHVKSQKYYVDAIRKELDKLGYEGK